LKEGKPVVDKSDPGSYNDYKIIFAIRYDGKIFVTLGAHVYCPSSDDLTTEEQRAIKYLVDKLGTHDVVHLTEHPLVGLECVSKFRIDD
jgi:hypothetical protein